MSYILFLLSIKPNEYDTYYVVLNTTTINPLDSGAIKRKLKKVAVHRNYNSRSSVCI